MSTALKIERVRRDLTQTNLANLTKIPQERISLLERGCIPKKEEAEILAKSLGLPVSKLFKWD